MKSIVFDSGPIISLAMNNLLWILEPLKKKYGGDFYMPNSVKGEVVDRPLTTKVYKFEAMQVQSLVRKGIFKLIYNNEINSLANHLLTLANSSFEALGNPINIVHYGEMQALASAIFLEADALVIDERITRLMLEKPDIVAIILKNKLHTQIKLNQGSLDEFKEHTRKIRVLRSVELAAMAFEFGMLDEFKPENQSGSRELLDGVIWGLKLKGCSVSEGEIERIIKLEKL